MKNTYIYAFPLERLPRISKTEDIIKDYNRNDLPADQLPVKKYTIEEFCELINDDMFNDQEYYARAVEEDDEVSPTVNDMYERYKKDIISLMRSEKLEEIEFDDNDGDLVYVFWQDRYDMWNRDPIVKVSIKDNDLVFDCRTDNDETVTLYSSSDYGCDLVSNPTRGSRKSGIRTSFVFICISLPYSRIRVPTGTGLSVLRLTRTKERQERPPYLHRLRKRILARPDRIASLTSSPAPETVQGIFYCPQNPAES